MEAATSDSLETAPKGSGARSIYKVVVNTIQYNTIKHSFNRRFSASQEDLMSP